MENNFTLNALTALSSRRQELRRLEHMIILGERPTEV